MKKKVYIKYHDDVCKIFKNKDGMFYDLRAGESVKISKNHNKLISLMVSMKLPKWYYAAIVPRSGTYSHFNVIQLNHYGVVDGPTDTSFGYSGNNDIWKFNAFALGSDAVISKGDRLCQFEVRLSMDAPWYVKLVWLFSSGFKFVEVSNLENKNRGGFGKSGKQ